MVSVHRHQEGFRFHYADDTQVWIDRDGSTIWCTWTGDTTLEDAAIYLSGPVLGFLLRLHGCLALHASAVQIDGRALALVGPHRAGKSTAAAGLAGRGCPVITDDVLCLRRRGDTWLAEPFGVHLRLWPEGVGLAVGAAADLPRLTPTWDKRALSIGVHPIAAAPGPVSLSGVLFLGDRVALNHAPRIDSIPASEGLVLLAAHSSAAHLLDADARATEFGMLGDLVRHVRIARAVACEDGLQYPAFLGLLHDWALRCTHSICN
jgi:hypothetical protein